MYIYGAWKRMSLMRHFWRENPCVVASETIYGMHENQSVKRSGQAGGAVRNRENKWIIPPILAKNKVWVRVTVQGSFKQTKQPLKI